LVHLAGKRIGPRMLDRPGIEFSLGISGILNVAGIGV
jgi:hypothetical protein